MRASAALLLATVLLGACQSAEVRDDRFVRFFDELTFGSGADGAGDKRAVVRRWEGPLVWSATGSEPFQEAVAARMAVIAAIAGRDADRVGEDGDIRITQDPVGTTYPVQDNLTSCFARVVYGGDQIIRVRIRIAEETPERVVRCIDHEMMHGLGFLSHSAAIASVMSPLHTQERLSRWDIMAIRALMSERLAAGTSRETALAEVARLLPDLRAFADTQAGGLRAD
ncbi:DUF2927 domain-containing protein [Thalassobaculum litoreum]|uniref:Uncharacterized protein n=1 Tax=Thalassobaculum litoreum DSM 18839 TaxID=1123362 RepID=A0A8G2BIR4_9PROT|nr:DUF2927 domain-containing protein [Thalassobaculum litoreum]SDF94268.1 hypothetical protein SAMN05660686_02832 [Thalassobaculum litoreum DSM 18839]